MIIFAYLISFSLGWLSIRSLFKNDQCLRASLHIPLAFGLGLGISALLTFCSFLIAHRFSPWLIIGLNLILLAILLYLNPPPIPKWNAYFSKKNIFTVGLALFWVILFFLIFFLSRRHPFGEWDAWALWNMKSKFLIFGGKHWSAIFNRLHWHTQPDYPLLLPFIHTWSYCFTQKELLPIPRITAVVFATLCPMLLYGGLQQFIKKEIALLAAALLVVNPFYMFLSTAQYADILLAFYLLASLITLTLTLRMKNKRRAILLGFILGLMTFTKNEGIAITLLLIGLLTIYLCVQQWPIRLKNGFKIIWTDHLKLIAYILCGLIFSASATIILKLFLAPPNRDILANLSQVELTFFNLKGLLIIKDAVLFEFFHQRWCLIWIFLTFLFLIQLPKFFIKECKVISLFFILYFSLILYIYLTTINFDLAWRLKSTLHRILFYLLPSLLFFSFYGHWRKNESENS